MVSAYSYEICYKPGKEQANVDALSCLPLPEHSLNILKPAEIVLFMNELPLSLTSASDIKTWTSKDSTLAQVLRATLRGW